MELELIDKGMVLTVMGMGTVFVFLTILVGVTTLMSRAVMRFSPVAGDSDDILDDKDEIAAVAAAVSRYRQEH